MATDRTKIETYLNEKEFSRLNQLSKQLKLSRSELLRRLLMNTPLPNAHTFEASRGIVDLLQVNADQARLGNLLKLAMDEPLSADLLRKFDQLTADIRATQDDLKKIAREIDASIGRKK